VITNQGGISDLIATKGGVYPTSGDLSVGQVGSIAGDMIVQANQDFMDSFTTRGSMRGIGSAQPMTGSGPSQASGPGGKSQAGGFVANPLTWVVVMAILVGITIFFAHKTGNKEEFSNIRGSFYNVFYVTFVAVVGILMLKTIVGRFKIPGLSDAILAV
jgi:hypothetical protein